MATTTKTVINDRTSGNFWVHDFIRAGRGHTSQTEDNYYAFMLKTVEKINSIAPSKGFGGVRVKSGFRDLASNNAIKDKNGKPVASRSSQHLSEYSSAGSDSAATDLVLVSGGGSGIDALWDACIDAALQGKLVFDQLINETRGAASHWLHVSLKTNYSTGAGNNRGMYFHMANDRVTGTVRYIDWSKVNFNDDPFEVVASSSATTGVSSRNIRVSFSNEPNTSVIQTPADDLKIKQITEPTIALSELAIPDTESGSGNATVAQNIPGAGAASLQFVKHPLINLNGYNIYNHELVSFCLDCDGDIPKVYYKFRDLTNIFTTHYAGDDHVTTRVYLRSPGDEKVYKPIRINFDTKSIN